MKKWTKVISLLVVVLIMGTTLLTGCKDKSELEKLQLMILSTKDLENMAAAKNVIEKYPGEMEWLKVSDADQKSMLFASGDYGDVIIGGILQDTDVSQYASTGVLIALDEYIREDLTPNICKLFAEHPSAKAVSTMPDGHIYSLPRFNGMESDYLESVLFINKVWLDRLNLEVPTTTEELYSVLKSFKEGDPNGNGKNDEIPMIFLNDSAFSFPEALLSCWGMSTKHGVQEGFLTVQDGEVKFAPATDEWKEMIKYYNRLYSEDLIDMEVFTQSAEQFQAKLASQNSVVGMTWSKTNPFTNQDEYIAISPISAPGYEIVWRKHPGALGIKNLFSITNKCTDIEGVMKWIDSFYTEEATIENWYGPVGDVFTLVDGMYTFNEPQGGKTLAQWSSDNTISSINFPGIFYEEEIGTLVEANELWTNPLKNFELYREHLDDEPWPRPYYSDESIKRISELRTDIFNVVSQKKAAWIVGNSDVESDWNDYIQSLNNIGLQEYIDLNQDAYDNFQAAMK